MRAHRLWETYLADRAGVGVADGVGTDGTAAGEGSSVRLTCSIGLGACGMGI
ncbi:MAG: hypothetical protein HC895_27020 [Leptolyngbyaceae cyanobacterium SM1_3_5]|nr:hypothetical protein [Leptolyngbyaceae cyanobacterium SM1_3_5]